MLRTSKELIFAFVTCIVVAACYGAVLFTREILAAGGFYGHTIGILGFVFMLLTETLYSLRKRTRSARWGRMADWLQFHIFTGIVGHFMVLLHILEVQRAGRCHPAADRGDCFQRFYWALYLYPHPAHRGWYRRPRAGGRHASISPCQCSPPDVALAHGSYPDRDGALYCRLCPHFRRALLRHAFTVAQNVILRHNPMNNNKLGCLSRLPWSARLSRWSF